MLCTRGPPARFLAPLMALNHSDRLSVCLPRAVASSLCWPAAWGSPKHLCISVSGCPAISSGQGPGSAAPRASGRSVPDSVPSWLHPRVDAALSGASCRGW